MRHNEQSDCGGCNWSQRCTDREEGVCYATKGSEDPTERRSILTMPRKSTAVRARRGKTQSAKAGEYVREEMEHIREGKHGARSAKQAIAIGLSQARRAGVKIPPRPGVKEVKATRRKPNPKRSKATHRALEREGSAAASHLAISRQVKKSARQRGSASLRRAAQKAVRTKGATGRRNAAVKAARTRARHKAQA
jgi:hypothetical protein